MAPKIKTKPLVKVDKVAQIRDWLKTQSPETQTRLGDLLEKGAIKEVEAQLPAGWANKNPTQSVPKAEGSAETTTPKAKGAKLKSVASNPAAKATKDAVAAEVNAAGKVAADTAGKAAAGAAKEAGPVTKTMQNLGQEFKNLGSAAKKGLGKMADTGAGKKLLNNKLAAASFIPVVGGRAMDMYNDMSNGQSFLEAAGNSKANKKALRGGVNSAMVGVGNKIGTAVGARVGAPTLAGLAGGVGMGLLSDSVMGAMGLGESEEPKAAVTQKAEPVKSTPSIGIEEASNWLKEKGMDASEGNFQKAFEELSKRQQEQINKTPEPKPSADTYKPSAKESVAMAEQAVKAPVGIQDKAPDIDWMSVMDKPDTQGMLAELAARQANQVQSAGNIPDFKPRKKNEDDEDGTSPSSTTTANVRPLPRFFVNTGRFGTMAGGGSRRSPSGRLL